MAIKPPIATVLGKHNIIDFYNCSPNALNNLPLLEKSFTALAREAGANILHVFFYHFSPHGITGLLAIKESHIALHTWPEYRYATVDVFSCSSKIDQKKFTEALKQLFKAQKTSIQEFERGNRDNFNSFVKEESF